MIGVATGVATLSSVLKHLRATVPAHLVGLLVCAGIADAQDSSSRFGHRAYAEASHTLVRSVGGYRTSGRVVQLLPVAAAAFDSLRSAARVDSVRLVPISGFRSVAYERELFARAIRRHGSDSAAARWVAPAGFSEHHTGLAIDIGDQGSPRCDTETCFASTRASRWLLVNAGRFGFELSFPEGNGAVSYEPWHWRFVGDSVSRAVFAGARMHADSAAILRAYAAHARGNTTAAASLWLVASGADSARLHHLANDLGLPFAVIGPGITPRCNALVPGDAPLGNRVRLSLAIVSPDSAEVQALLTCTSGSTPESLVARSSRITYSLSRRSGRWAVVSVRAAAG